jgi:hypothetical protein
MLHGATGAFGQQLCVVTGSAQANAGKPAKNMLANKNVRLKIRRNIIGDLSFSYQLMDR